MEIDDFIKEEVVNIDHYKVVVCHHVNGIRIDIIDKNADAFVAVKEFSFRELEKEAKKVAEAH